MTVDDLQTAVDGLSTERLTRLVDRLERDPDVKVTVGASRLACPMVLAGFNPQRAEADQPEHRFAVVWDQFARSEARSWIRLRRPRRTARRADVQLLLRRANAVLAYRSVRDRSGDASQPRLRPASSRSGSKR